MNKEEVISQGYLEAYLNEDLSNEEMIEVERYIEQDEEIRQEFNSIQHTIETLAISYGIRPSEVVKTILINEISSKSNSVAYRTNGWKLMIAASVIISLSSLFTAFYFWNKWKGTEQELTQLIAQNLQMAQNFNQVNDELSNIREDLSVLISPEFSRIILNGTENAPTAQAVIYWNAKQGNVYLNSVSLSPLAAGQQYQLWAIVDGQPVNAGIFDANQSTFKEMNNISSADSFAVTIEKPGGSTTPTLSTMQVIGNISS